MGCSGSNTKETPNNNREENKNLENENKPEKNTKNEKKDVINAKDSNQKDTNKKPDDHKPEKIKQNTNNLHEKEEDLNKVNKEIITPRNVHQGDSKQNTSNIQGIQPNRRLSNLEKFQEMTSRKQSTKVNPISKDKRQSKKGLSKVNEKPKVIFAVFAPGTNKLDLFSEKFKTLGFEKVSTRELLREEIKHNTSLASNIKSCFDKHVNVSGDIVTDLLIRHIDSQIEKGHSRFLIGGFPRSEDNTRSWKSKAKDKYDVIALIFVSYTRKEYEIEVEERKIETGAEMSNDEIMKRFDDFILNTNHVDDDFGRSLMIRYSAKVRDDLMAEEVFNNELFSSLK